MKYNFCTLFDSNYLYKGLALYQSLCDVNVEFHIYVVAFDDECYLTLKKLNLDKLTVISLSEFETEELLAVKNSRNRAEYCWTSGPSVIYHFMMQYQLSSCTYLDADLNVLEEKREDYRLIFLNRYYRSLYKDIS